MAAIIEDPTCNINYSNSWIMVSMIYGKLAEEVFGLRGSQKE